MHTQGERELFCKWQYLETNAFKKNKNFKKLKYTYMYILFEMMKMKDSGVLQIIDV